MDLAGQLAVEMLEGLAKKAPRIVVCRERLLSAAGLEELVIGMAARRLLRAS
jgi:hypothetical protein